MSADIVKVYEIANAILHCTDAGHLPSRERRVQMFSLALAAIAEMKSCSTTC